MKRALVALLLFASPALADDKANAKALFQQGIDLYKAKKYDESIAALARSYQLDAQFDTLYALAQAERLGGRCADAIPHYEKIVQQTTDPMLAQAVQNNMGLCPGHEKKQECTTDSGGGGGPPVVTPKPRNNTLPIALFTGSGIAAGLAIGMFVAAGANQDAAAVAPSYGDYNRLTESAGLERGLGYAFTAVAVVGVGAAVYVSLRKPHETTPTVSASVSPKGTMVLLQARW